MLIIPLPVAFTFGNREEIIYPVLLDTGKNKILTDCGYPGFMPLLENVIQGKGYSLADLTDIIITHHDLDHVGALYEISQAYPHITIHTSPVEQPFVSG